MTDDLEQRLREDSKAGVGAGSDWSAEECATYWARQCSTARRNAAEAADEIARLRKALGEAAENLEAGDKLYSCPGLYEAAKRARTALQKGSRHE